QRIDRHADHDHQSLHVGRIHQVVASTHVGPHLGLQFSLDSKRVARGWQISRRRRRRFSAMDGISRSLIWWTGAVDTWFTFCESGNCPPSKRLTTMSCNNNDWKGNHAIYASDWIADILLPRLPRDDHQIL